MSTSDRFARLGQQVRTEIQATAKTRSAALFGDVPPGTEDVGKKQAIEMAARNWADPSYRQALLTRVLPANFRDTAIPAVGGNNPASWPDPPDPKEVS